MLKMDLKLSFVDATSIMMILEITRFINFYWSTMWPLWNLWWTCFYMMDSFTRLTAIKAWLEKEKLWLCFTTKYLSNASTIEHDITTEYRFISLFNPMSNCCFLSVAIYRRYDNYECDIFNNWLYMYKFNKKCNPVG